MDQGLKRYEPNEHHVEVFGNKFGTTKAVVCTCGFATTYTMIGNAADHNGMKFFVHHHADRLASTEAMRKALEAAWHALKSYEYGNASPDLAREVGLVIYTALAARAALKETP